MAVQAVTWRKRHYPFNAAQTVNILGEIGPLVAMFLVNGIYGIAAGTWSLIGCTLLSLISTLVVLGRPPVMPFIAGAVSIPVNNEPFQPDAVGTLAIERYF